jgi:hypothetical protein
VVSGDAQLENLVRYQRTLQNSVLWYPPTHQWNIWCVINASTKFGVVVSADAPLEYLVRYQRIDKIRCCGVRRRTIGKFGAFLTHLQQFGGL